MMTFRAQMLTVSAFSLAIFFATLAVLVTAWWITFTIAIAMLTISVNADNAA